MNHAAPAPGDGAPLLKSTTKLATRLSFLIPGIGIACWAPLVPFAKKQIGLDEASLGFLLLFLGMGSVMAMPMAGGLAAKVGSRRVIAVGSVGVALVLPMLALASAQWELATALFFFGASLGAVDVAANIHGIEVEQREGRPMMSNFHGFYSFGGLAGSALMTALLTAGVRPFAATIGVSVLLMVALGVAVPSLLRTRSSNDAPFFVRPRGIVLLIGVLIFIVFLIEGALLDWSAVILEESRGVEEARAGIGFVLFSLAMAVTRFAGDGVIARFGGRKVLLGGSLLASAGLALVVAAPWTWLAIGGFLVIGFGAATLVPVLFSAAGRQKVMPVDLAISAISIMGYTGILAGPAAIGFIAKQVSLPGAFSLLAAMVLVVAFFSRIGERPA
ncbi:MFS transporter [Luteolibacter flavescens]|uniref:MFS transporter n=1 Tax=Luteolibacter flavescens TaxID=1859460 RepID=A0ABT3FNI9_9BACT|nr:MFS transporter [Luteolibacter flavescens]MCW1884811.1 MFS transporter [Luteolibacter flavescens]